MKISHFLAISSVLAASVACHDFAEAELSAPERSTIISVRPSTGISSKAPVNGSTFPSDRTMVMSARHNSTSGTSSDFFSGIVFSYDGEAWSSDKYWPSEGSLDLLAYSADGLAVTAEYGADAGAAVTLSVPDNSESQVDILWAGAGAQTGGTQATPLLFRHALTSMTFAVEPDADFDPVTNTGISIDSIVITSLKIAGKAVLRRDMTCSWKELEGEGDIVLKDSCFLVIPQESTSFIILYTQHCGRDASGIAVDRKGLSFRHECQGEWAEGRKYVYTLHFEQGNSLSVHSSIYDWITDECGVTLSGKVSASYDVREGSEVSIPPAVMAAGSIVGADWGDGCSEIFQGTRSTLSMDTLRLSHTYTSTYNGPVNINVLRGSLDFGKLKTDVFNRFTVNDPTRVSLARTAPADLSFRDIYGAESTQRNTANSYVISEKGEYMLPLVYGNAIKNSLANAAAYTNLHEQNFCDFVNHLGNVISSPYIESNDGCIASSAELVWQTGPALISDVRLFGMPDCNCLAFNVNSIPEENGLALLAVRDASGNIMWSWMIWLTRDNLETLTVINDYDFEYEILPENLGAIWNEDRTMYGGPYFQWGRKDPLLPCNGSGQACRLYDIDGNECSAWGVLGQAKDKSSEKTIFNAIRNPCLFFTDYNRTNNWFNKYSALNLWDSSIHCTDVSHEITGRIKTVYDPCPSGFMVPCRRAFYYFDDRRVGGFNNGFSFELIPDSGISSLFPALGFISGVTSAGELLDMFGDGRYWYCNNYDDGDAGMFSFWFGGGSSYDITSNDASATAGGNSVRPCREPA